MPQGYRPDRVADQIRAEISQMLAREVHDPGIGFITVTRVQVSPDLQLARIYYTTIGTESQRKATVKALRRALPFLHYQIGKRLRLRRVPVLEFFFDKSIEHQARVEQLIREIHEADAGPDAANDDPEPDEN
jgi:ribosome-binding factor A